MKAIVASLSVAVTAGFPGLVGPAFAHVTGGTAVRLPHDGWASPSLAVAPPWFLAQATPGAARPAAPADRPAQAGPFGAFAPRVTLRWDRDFLYVEGNGLPAHGMMVGITAWQQQVPLPQAYLGGNAWRIPRQPVAARQPQTIRDHFLRGAIALAVNGIPIFNPQNNRGEISQEIGELDEWGGHCGRADDYHYHAAPLHLQSIVGPGQPIAYALDGYPIYGVAEPDGAPAGKLDEFNGHDAAGLGYHYHGSTKYPYVNGGFHGEVVERGGQVDPQPRAQPVREALPPLRGARITGFTAAPDGKAFALRYTVDGRPAAVNYAAAGEGVWRFQFSGPDGSIREQTYRAGDRRGGRPEDRRGGPPPDPLEGPKAGRAPEQETPVRTGGGFFVLRSPAVADGGALPVEFTGDGASSTLPLEWSGAPAATRNYAVIMHHVDPEGKTKWYWTLYNIPPSLRGLPKDAGGVGALGNNSINGRVGYAPPHSKGPGAKTYILTVYALSGPVTMSVPPEETDRDRLLAAMQGLILASAELRVVYTRTGAGGAGNDRARPAQTGSERFPPRAND